MIGNAIGKLGEDIAEEFLRDKGYKVIHKNYWKPYGEIDIICEKQGIAHFIEVKSVTCDLNNVSRESLRPEDNLHKNKLRRLGNVIQAYIATFHVKDWVFDVVVVYIDKESKKAGVRVLPNQVVEGR